MHAFFRLMLTVVFVAGGIALAAYVVGFSDAYDLRPPSDRLTATTDAPVWQPAAPRDASSTPTKTAATSHAAGVDPKTPNHAVVPVAHTVDTEPSETSPAGPSVQESNLVKDLVSLIKTIQDAPAPAPAAPAPPDQSAVRKREASPNGSAAPQAQVTRVPGEGDNRLRISIQDADIRGVLQQLSEQGGLNILPSANVKGTVSATLQGVDVLTALEGILKSTGYRWERDDRFIFVGTPEDLELMRRGQDQIATRLYRPNYVRAADLEQLITPILTLGVGVVSPSPPSDVGIQEDTTTAGGDSYAEQETLLVRDYEDVLAQIDQIVKQVDRRPTQVAIEAMILSVKLDDTNELGVDFELFRDKDYLRVVSGSPLSSLGSLSLTDGGLKVGFLDSSLALFVDALEKIGDTNVIATPHLLCLNKHRAQIKIGADLGYVSQTLTAEGTIVPEVEFLDVGTQLRLRPFISSDGLIRMEVHPEISKGSVRVEDGLTLPDKETTEVTTNIIVPDGHTVVIGGLLRDELTQSTSQIPYFGSLPIVGPLFRQTEEGTERQEILILITPRIIYEPEMSYVGDTSAAEFHQRQAIYADKQTVFGKRYVGRKYQRLARDAWMAGNEKRALRLVNLAIHFDPLNRASIRLRSDIWEASGVSDEEISAGSALDGEHVAPWLLDRLDGAEPYHPVEPGRAGEMHPIVRPSDASFNDAPTDRQPAVQ